MSRKLWANRPQVCAKDEVVVDMFAGLGYFSIPLAMASGVVFFPLRGGGPAKQSFFFRTESSSVALSWVIPLT